MEAILIGATGATGRDLLDLLLKDESFRQVVIFVRRQVTITHPRLRVHVVDFEKPAEWAALVKGDVLFSCLGTTLKAAGSKEAQWKVDHDYQLEFAKAAKANAVSGYVLVSAGYADPDSTIFYSRMKGQLESAVRALGFRALVIFRPPILVRKGSDRFGEVAGIKVIKFFNRFGLLRSQAPLSTEELARAMVAAATKFKDGIQIIEAAEIRRKFGKSE